MNTPPGAAVRAAKAIERREPVPTSDPQARAYAEAFYALAVLLPPVAYESVSSRPRRVAGEDTTGAPGRDRRPGTRGAMHRLTLYAAAFVTVIALVLVLVLRPPDRFEPRNAIYLVPTAAAPTARGVVLVAEDELLLYASGLSALESGYRYVLWRVDSGDHRRIGSVVSLGSGRVRLRAGVGEEPSRLELTIEQVTATGPPTGPTVLAGLRVPGPDDP